MAPCASLHPQQRRMYRLTLNSQVKIGRKKKSNNNVFPISAQTQAQVMRVIDLHAVSVAISKAHIINAGTCLIKLGLFKWWKCTVKHYPPGS